MRRDLSTGEKARKQQTQVVAVSIASVCRLTVCQTPFDANICNCASISDLYCIQGQLLLAESCLQSQRTSRRLGAQAPYHIRSEVHRPSCHLGSEPASHNGGSQAGIPIASFYQPKTIVTVFASGLHTAMSRVICQSTPGTADISASNVVITSPQSGQLLAEGSFLGTASERTFES